MKRAALEDVAILCLTMLAPAIALASEAHSEKVLRFDIPGQRADQALIAFAEQADVTFIFPVDATRKVTANAVQGEFTAGEAVRRLLQGTGLHPWFQADGELVVKADDSAQQGETMKKRGLIASLIATFAGANAVAANAQEGSSDNADASEPRALEEIVVTAQKRAQSIMDVPMSISALDATAIEKKGVGDVLDLSFTVPGFTVREEGPGRQRLFMRGIGNTSGSDVLTSAYLDEAPINTVSSGQALNTVDMLGVRTTDLERIEVLRGPQGTLYGSGAMSGTVRFITKDPNLERWGSKGELSLTATEDGDPSQEVTAIVNAPVVQDVFGLRLATTFSRLGGWIDQPAASGENIEDVNNQDLVDVRLKALWRISDTFSAKATAIVHRNESDVGTSISDEDRVFRPGFDPTTRIPFTDNSELFNLALTYQLPFADLLSSSTYIDQKNRNLYGFKDTGRTLFPTYESIGDVHKSAKVFTQELRLTSSSKQAFSWIVGTFYRDRSGRQQELDQNVFEGAEFTQSFDTLWESTAWAVFGDVTLKLGERFEVGGGVRYFEDEQSAFNYLIPGFTRLSDTFGATTWRAFGTYHVTERIAAYANVATGFRSGGYILDPQVNTPAFGPETLLSYEFGIKGAFFGGRLVGDIAIFNSDYKDMLQRSLRLIDNTFLDVVANVGEAGVKGIDASFKLQVTDHLSLDFAGSVSDGKVEKVDPLNNPAGARPGDPLDYVPDYSYSVGAEYAFGWSAQAPGYFRVNYYARDKITALDRGTNANLMESDKLAFLDARIGASVGQWSFQLFAENLLDEYGSMDPWQDWGITLRPRPRTYGITVSVDFD